MAARGCDFNTKLGPVTPGIVHYYMKGVAFSEVVGRKVFYHNQWGGGVHKLLFKINVFPFFHTCMVIISLLGTYNSVLVKTYTPRQFFVENGGH